MLDAVCRRLVRVPFPAHSYRLARVTTNMELQASGVKACRCGCGANALVPRTQRGTKCCAAEPWPMSRRVDVGSGSAERREGRCAASGTRRALLQLLHIPQRWKQLHPQQRDRDGPDAAEHGARHRAEQRCGDAAFELAELV